MRQALRSIDSPHDDREPTQACRSLGDAPIRILLIGMNYTPERSGIAPYTAGMAERLAARGDRVRVITTFPHYPEWRFTDDDGRAWSRSVDHGVDVLRYRHRLPARGSAVSRVLSELSFGVRALFAHWDDPDVVVLVSPAMFASALLSLRVRLRRGRRLIVWIQDLYGPGVRETGAGDRFGLSGRLVSAVESGLVRHANGVAVIHERMIDEVVSLGARRRTTSVVRNWSHVQMESRTSRATMRARLGWGEQETIVLHTGNMGAKQDLGNVIAAARIADERELPLRFVLMGDGNTRAQLEAEAAHVRRLTFSEPLAAENYLDGLRAADILLVNEHPSLRLTALPSKLTSYFASGRPVVAATAEDSLTAAELALADTGTRVDPANPRALIEAVSQLAREPLRMRRLAENGKRYRSSRLTEDAAAASFTDLLTRVSRRFGDGVPRRSRRRTERSAGAAPTIHEAGDSQNRAG